MSNYTPELVEKMVAHGSFTHADAVEFADAHGLKTRSVISKVINLGIPYERKPERVTKRGEPVVQKAQFVEAIEAATQVTIPTLVKMTKADLEKLTEALGAEMPQPR